MKFTDSQKLACDISRNIAVTAGAGSGKTSVLVRRYLWCLEQNDYQVRRLVAITFSEKAAGEMLQRIRKTIFEYLEGKQGDPQRWETVLEQLPLANISTIHGFCQRLLREFPVEAEVDPNFEVFDEAARHILLNRLLDDLIQELAASDDADMRLLAHFWTPLQLRGILRQLLDFRDKSRPWSEHILQSNFPAYLNALYELKTQLQQRKLDELQQDREWQECIERIPGLIPPGDTSKLSLRCRTVLELDAEFRQQNELDRQTLTLNMLRKNLSLVGVNKAWKEDKRNEQLKSIFGTLKTLHARSVPEYEIHDDLEQSSFHAQQALARLFENAYERYRQKKRSRRILDFDDLQEAASRLTEHPEVRPILSRRFDYLMVDEFQDTNTLQWDIIRSFGQSGNDLEEDRFCVVGDEKQSIYMFRGANVAVFADVREELQKANEAHNILQKAIEIPELGDLPEQREEQRRGELIMAENFRSSKELIFFFNKLFSRLFLEKLDSERPFDVAHQHMRSLRASATSSENNEKAGTHRMEHPVEFLFSPKESANEADGALSEVEQIALRILDFVKRKEPESPPGRGDNIADLRKNSPPGPLSYEERGNTTRGETAVSSASLPLSFQERGLGGEFAREGSKLESPAFAEKENPSWKFSDIAILLRTRTRLKEFEEALRRYEIPFVVAGGIGFYEQQEIYDLANLLRFLSDSRQDIALTGVLRSPLFSFSDDQLFYVSAGILSDEVQRHWNLWECLRHHAQTLDLIPEEFDASKFSHAYQRLVRWKKLADRIPITHLLRQILDESGLYGILRGSERAEQSLNNIEKLLDIARKFENEGFQSLTDFVSYFDELIAIEEREGEAQLSTEGMNVVQLMTIHASKGLEFPIVFVPELERPFNYGSNEPIYLDALLEQYRRDELGSVIAGIKGLDPDNNYAPGNSFLREVLKTLNEEKTDAEMKRLLYVACTRAKDCLILSATLKKSLNPASWLAWLDKVFTLREQIAQESRSIMIQPSDADEDVEALEIPLRFAANLEIPPSPPLQKGGDSGVSSTQQKVSKEFVPGGPGGISSELLTQMRHNLSPLKGPENELFHVSPSTLHLLYQCPRKYYYQEILGLKGRLLRQLAPPFEEMETPPSYGAKRGTIIHTLFEEQVFDVGWQQEFQLKELLKSEGIPPNSKEIQRLRQAIELAGEHYAASGLQQILADSPKLYREHPFQLKIGQAVISGVIDVLFRDSVSKVWTILDYKSNEVEESQIEAEIEKHGYNLQMQIYALAVTRLMQTEKVHSILFFTHPGSRYETVALSPAVLQQVEESLTDHLRNISQNKIASAENHQECDECGFRHGGICRHYSIIQQH